MMIFRTALVALTLCASMFAQSPEVSISSVPLNATQSIFGYTGTNMIYACVARSIVTLGQRPAITVAISAATNASPVVFTSATHGFAISSRPQVTIFGGTGNWTAVNVTATATVIDANTFSIAVDSSGFGAVTGSLKFRTTAPRSTVAEWAVTTMTYDGSSNLIWKGWLNGVSSYTQKCSEAALTTTNIQ